MKRLPRVMVVDDSAFARTVLSRILRSTGTIDVVGTARDGRDALERIDMLDPDLITLDLTMPELDGIGVLQALKGRARPRVLIVSISSVETELGVEALSLGAIDVLTKPTALANDRLNDLGDELIAKVMAACASMVDAPLPVTPHAIHRSSERVELVMIGTSTGGPQALTRLMTAMRGTLSAPIAMVLHIPIGYTEALAARLDKLSALTVVEASDGLELKPGMAVLGRGGMHLRIERIGHTLYARLADLPISSFMPSVNELFKSGAQAVGAGALGVVLTGMGDDGLIGARLIAAAKGSLLTEASSSCIVYGMPRSVYEANLGAESIPLENMAEEIGKRA